MNIIILAGGGGSRLFPLSRQAYPKQFLKLEDETSLLAHTVQRFLPIAEARDIYIVTNERYRYHVANELSECGAEAAHVLYEPVGRNTAPAIALALAEAQARGAGEDEVFVVAAADHVIRPQEVFENCIRTGAVTAKDDALVTFGIPATRPETGYGYIEAGERAGAAYDVVSFHEKPQLAQAEAFVAAGNFYWNSGMFAFTRGWMERALRRYAPEIAAVMAEGSAALRAAFEDLPSISIDYAIAEKADCVKMVPLTCYWNDIGSWDAMYDILPKDAQGNAKKGDILTLGCRDSLFMGRDRLIAGIGLEDLLLVETDDVIVVAKKGESQRVKEVVEELKRRNRKEAVEHTTVYHAWGTSSVLGAGPGYRMKKVRVLPSKCLTLQMHYHRTEHWIILRGTAEVRKGAETMYVHEQESVFIPQVTRHQLRNPGRIPLDLIEIQNGAYIAEDDIERYPEEGWTSE